MFNSIYEKKLSIQEILVYSSKTLFDNKKPFFILALLFGIPISILQVLIVYFLADNPLFINFLNGDILSVIQNSYPQSAMIELYKFIFAIVFMSEGILPLYIMTTAIITDSYIKGSPLPMLKAFSLAFSKWHIYMLFAIIKITLLFITAPLIVVPLLIYIWLYFTPYILALNNLNVAQLIKEGILFSKGRLLKILFYILFFTFLKYGITQFVGIILFWAPYPLLVFATECVSYMFYVAYGITFLNLYHIRLKEANI